MRIDDILSQTELFHGATPALQEEMLAVAVPATVPAGTFYIHEGDTAQHLAVVGAGRLRVFKVGESGREITLYHVCAGECCLLNMISLLSGTPSPASAVALLPVAAALLPAANFRSWVANHRGIREYVFGRLSDQVATMMSLVEEITFARMDRRLAGFLLDRAPRRTGVVPHVAMTHDQIARELGTAREVVSRLLKDLERKGIVELERGRIRIADRQALAAES